MYVPHAKFVIDSGRGDSVTHKPLLLLVLCDLVSKESLSRNALPLLLELALPFYTYWSILAGRRPQRPDARLLFHHLSGRLVQMVAY
jgi:predicted restriction endonuclease